MSKKAVIYTRVSTDQQAEKGYSLRDQEDKLRRYCHQNTIQVIKHFQEDYSAKDFNRPEWKLLMAYLGKNKNDIDYFMFAKWDRFSRNLEAGLKVLGQIKSMGIEINCLENNVDDSIPENKLIQTIMLLIPEIENERRSINVTNGMRRAMKEGRWPRQAPMGYTNARDKDNRPIIIPDELNAPLVQQAFKKMADGDHTQQEIRLALYRKGLRCSKNNFSLLLRNPFYIGKVLIPEYRDEPMSIVNGLHEPIIDEFTFYKVQDILEGRNKKRNGSVKKMARPELPLRGFLKCGSCGQKMTGSGSKGNGGRYFYYHCPSCNSRYRADLANQKVEQLLEKFALEDEVKELFIRMVQDRVKQSRHDKDVELRTHQKEITMLKQRKERLEDNFLDGKIQAEDYSRLNQKISLNLSNLQHMVEGITQSNEDLNTALVNSIQTITSLKRIYVKASMEGKQKIIGSIFPRKFVFDKNKVRTNEINGVVALIMRSSKAFPKITEGRPGKHVHMKFLF